MSLKRKSPEPDRPLREGEWMCASCNAKNYSARITCYKCPMTKQESEVRLKGKSALDWECYKCKANNFSFRNTCFKCLISKRESDYLKADREGVPWCCRFCNLENFPHRRDCFKCKRIKEDADVIPPRRMMSPPRRGMSPPRRGSPPPMMGYPRDRWDRSPPRPGMFPRGRSPMRGPSPPRMMPGRSRSPPIGRRLLPSPPRRAVSPLNKAVPMETEGEWICQLCNTGNVSQRRDCYKCTTPRGEGSGPVQGSVHSRIGSVVKPKSEKKLKKGQWICTACDVVCYANKKECFKCKAAKDTVARSEDLHLSITIDNIPKEKPQVVLNHSMMSEPDTPPVKRSRPNEGAPSLPARNQWGPDWTCRFCRVDVFPKRGDCFKCGRLREECDIRGDPRSSPRFDLHGVGPRDRLSPGPRARGCPDPRDRLGLDPRDRLGPGPGDRYIAGPRDRFSPGPRDRYHDGPDPRDRCGPGPRDAPGGSGPPPGYTCRCGNFNRMTEPDCVRCGRPNEHRLDPRELWSRGGPSRSPPRFYSNTPRNRPPSPSRKVNKSDNKDIKYAPDWNCSKCNFSNFAKRAKCKKCSAKKEDVEDKTAAAEKTPKSSTSEKVDNEVGGKTLSEEMDNYIALWHECEADSEKKLTEGEVDRKKIMRMKRIARRLLTKQTKKDPDTEETKAAKEKYDCLCSLHQKSIRDIKGSDLDWDCPKCDAYNWANRNKCFKCAAEKSVTDQGEAEEVADGEPSSSDAAQQNPETSNAGTADSNPVETEEDAVKAEEDKVTITEEAEEISSQKEEAREELMTPENCSDKNVNFGQDY